jgi:uncharacterized protein (DUF1501 family)
MDGCHEHAVTRSRLVRRAGSVVPVPADALRDGASAYLGQGRTRREALVGGIGLAVGVAAATRLDPLGLVRRASAAQAVQGPAPIIVSVFLDGGNDGLNTLVPRTASSDRAVYDSLRPLLGIPDDGRLLDVTGADAALNLGWHPSAAGLKALHEAGKLSIFPATDYPNPDYSHFHSGHFWRTGVLDRSYSVQTGWLGRYLDIVGSETSPLQGVRIDWSSDEVLMSRKAATAVVHAPEDFAVTSPDVRDPARLMAALQRLGGPARTDAYRHARAQTQLTYRTWRSLDPLATSTDPPAPGYPDGSELGAGLRNLARLIGAGLGVRVASISQPGYDTHDGQDKRHPLLLADLGASLGAWQADIEARGLGDRVLTIVWSEFGRRVADNASYGTDHGAGGLVMLLGNGLHAGIHADTWNLAQIDALDGNIPVQTDFRDVYAGVLQEHLGIEAARVLPGYAGTPVRVRA